MGTLGAKGRQAELHAREAHFLRVAREILLGNDGYQAVSIDRIAEETGFSRGTVYQRFRTKDDLLIALGSECRATLVELIRRGARCAGRPRERMAALGETLVFYSTHYADDQRILKLIDAEMILKKAPDNQRETMKGYDIRVYELVLDVIQDGIAQGDLVLKGDRTASGLCFAFWTLIDGSFSASMGGAPLAEAGIENPTAEAVRNGHYLMDAYGWRPLYDEWDYATITRNVRESLSNELMYTDNSVESGLGFRPRPAGDGA